MQRALQRAQAAPKTQVGRRPVPRSEPPRVKEMFVRFKLFYGLPILKIEMGNCNTYSISPNIPQNKTEFKL